MSSVLRPRDKRYCVSGSANLFPQHCISPPYSHETHIKELSTELKESLQHSTWRAQTLTLVETLACHLDAYVSRTPFAAPAPPRAIMTPDEQRVFPTLGAQLPPLQRVTAAPATILANNPTAPCILCTKPYTHHDAQGTTPPARYHKLIKLTISPRSPASQRSTSQLHPPQPLHRIPLIASIQPRSPVFIMSGSSAKRQSTE
jgi:hypothetical protein